MLLREFVAMGKMFYNRGSSWIAIFLGFASIATMVKVYEDFFRIQFGMQISTVLGIIIPCYIIMCVIIGYLDYKWGLMKAEADVGYRAAPLADKQREEVSEILRLLKK